MGQGDPTRLTHSFKEVRFAFATIARDDCRKSLIHSKPLGHKCKSLFRCHGNIVREIGRRLPADPRPGIPELTMPTTRRLMTHPGVGALTALAFVLIIGNAERFQCGKQVASYLGLVPLEKSSGNRRRLGHITKTGSSMMRFLLVEAAQVTVRSLPEWRSQYFRLMMSRGQKTAKVAMARRLATRLYWMWREGRDYQQQRSSVRTQDSPEQAMVCRRTPSN